MAVELGTFVLHVSFERHISTRRVVLLITLWNTETQKHIYHVMNVNIGMPASYMTGGEYGRK